MDPKPGVFPDASVGLLALLLFFVVWSLRATVFFFVDESITSDTWRSIYSTSIKFTLWVLPAIAFVGWIRRISPWNYLGFATIPTPREWAIAALATSLFLGAVASLELMLGGKSLQPAMPAAFAFSMLAASALIEEILFRGLVLRELTEHFRRANANVIASLLFVAVHWPHWLWSRGFSASVFADSVGVFLASLLFGWLYLRTRSVWPCLLAHVANNVVAGFLVASSS